MICCVLASLTAAMTGWKGLLRRPLRGALSLAALALGAFTAVHAGHYIARARDHDRALWRELLAQPICTGAPHARAAAGEGRARES
jgi:hypothetical protein